MKLLPRTRRTLRRTARRYSICVDDAEDAYQRALEILLTKGGNDTMTISYHLIRIANEQNKTSEGAAISYVMLFMVIVLTNLYLYLANRRSQGA